MVDDSFFMQKALDSAWQYQGLTYPNPPVGAIIVDENQNIISIGLHKKAGGAHAELEAVYKALLYYKKDIDFLEPNKLHKNIIKNYKNFFKDHTIYVTLEPCNHYGKTPPCSLLLKEMGFKKVAISLRDPNKKASGGIDFLKDTTQIVTEILYDEGKKLLYPFMIWQKKKPFIFFKVAVSQNWVYTGGIISSQKSREFVHKIREVVDLLVIGGESVRVDRPILDTRLASSKNPPDVFIFSKKDDFDRTIPLFGISERKVYIGDDLDFLKNYNYIMVEGGENLYKSLKDKIDAILIFQTKNHIKGRSFEFAKEFKRLKKFKYFDDTIEWKVKEFL